jgi:hypothetical protein
LVFDEPLIGEVSHPATAARAPHPLTPSAASPLFSITFSLCSGDFDVS